MIDYNNSNRISIDDFFKVLNESNLNINSYELQSIFQDYEIFSNGVVYYNKIIDKLFGKYYSKNREIYAENLYDKLTNNGQFKISLNDIKHLYYNTPNNDPRKNIFMKFIDKYKYITKDSIDKPMSIYDMKKLIKYIGYGIEFDDQLYDLLYELENNNNNNFKSNYYDNQILKSNNNYYDNYSNFQYDNKSKNNNIIMKLRKSLIQYGRKSFFDFIKQFKYYDNNTKTISKYDFMKILQDFNIRIPDSDINQLFNEYGVNYKKTIINYLNFINELSNFSINQNRDNEIKKAANFIYKKSNELRKPININFLKEIYSPENNYFIKDSNENKIDFIDCLELFHYAFKGFNHDIIYEEEFIEFYHFISFLIENDNNFISLLNNEWREKDNYKNENNTNFNFTFGKNQNNENYNLKNQNRHFNNLNNNYDNYNSDLNKKYNRNQNENNYNNNNPLEKLKEKLKIRGVRGLLYLHKQFLLSCPNTSKISLNDFKKILLSQHIFFSDSEYENIFYQFSKDNINLDFISFIREFKKELNKNKLNYVEDAYSILNINQNEKVPIEYIKRKYDAKNHPDVISGKKTEEEKLLEFIDCFEINFDLLNQYSNVNFIDFEIFANFYEYVAFVYDNDKIFGKILTSTFH